MNYAVHSATAVAFSCRRQSAVVTPFGKLVKAVSPTTERRITINVGGERFQTYENTLARHPDSLLGSPIRRQEFYNAKDDELAFPARNKYVFNAILFFYQAEILSRPEDIPLDVFIDEIRFFDLARYSCEVPSPIIVKAKRLEADNTARRRVWNFIENPRTKIAHVFAKFNLLLVFVWLLILCLETSVDHFETVKNNGRALSENRTSALNGTETTKLQKVGKVLSNFSGENNASDLLKNSTTMPSLTPARQSELNSRSWDRNIWFVINTIFVVWFTLDYLLHIACEPCLRAYLVSLAGFFDLITILPYYITVITRLTGAMLLPQMGIVRFLRIFRLFKASRYSSSFRILLGSLTSSAKDFPIWFIIMVMHIIFFSSILYYVESSVGNPQFSNIPDVMYFTVITMCAVGYGDAVPQSSLGKLVTSLAALSGIVIVYCIPAPTLKTNFNRLNELHKSERKERQRLKENGGPYTNANCD